MTSNDFIQLLATCIKEGKISIEVQGNVLYLRVWEDTVEERKWATPSVAQCEVSLLNNGYGL